MEHAEQMVMSTMQSVANLMDSIRTNPMSYRAHYELLEEIEDLAKQFTDVINRAELEQMAVSDALNNVEAMTLTARLKVAGL